MHGHPAEPGFSFIACQAFRFSHNRAVASGSTAQKMVIAHQRLLWYTKTVSPSLVGGTQRANHGLGAMGVSARRLGGFDLAPRARLSAFVGGILNLCNRTQRRLIERGRERAKCRRGECNKLVSEEDSFGLDPFHDLSDTNSCSRFHASSISFHAQFTSVTAHEMVCNGM